MLRKIVLPEISSKTNKEIRFFPNDFKMPKKIMTNK